MILYKGTIFFFLKGLIIRDGGSNILRLGLTQSAGG